MFLQTVAAEFELLALKMVFLVKDPCSWIICVIVQPPEKKTYSKYGARAVALNVFIVFNQNNRISHVVIVLTKLHSLTFAYWLNSSSDATNGIVRALRFKFTHTESMDLTSV